MSKLELHQSTGLQVRYVNKFCEKSMPKWLPLKREYRLTMNVHQMGSKAVVNKYTSSEFVSN
jgi:hypothetical protein